LAYALLIEGACAARRAKRSTRGAEERSGAAVFAALLAFAGSGCFTGPINHVPELTISGPATPPRRQPEPEPYNAKATDADGDQPTVMWYVDHNNSCPDANDRANWPPSGTWVSSTPDPNTLMITGSDIDGPFCVWAFATDSHGAVQARNVPVEPYDQAPTANIQVVAPNPSPSITTDVLYPLYSTIELSPDASADPEDDVLTWGWTLVPPVGSKATRMDCNDGHQCFTADVPGTYQVTLVATDPAKKTGTVTRTISVNVDQPPCIVSESTMPSDQLLTPIQYDSKTNYPNQISVGAVHDDGDPYPSPGSVLHFRWSVSKNGEPFAPVDNDFSFLPLDSNQAPGSLVKVRLEVLDRNPTTAAALFGCGVDKDFCYAGAGTSCPQRVSWSIEY
jgi:hypothetical protein